MVQENCLNNSIIVICGPTASGKSELAIRVAKELNSEIVCADSLTIYKGLDIGTAKVTENERCGIKHHMIDVVNPNEEFSVVDYKEMAIPIVDNILSKGKIPIICGGTGFYINSILFNLSYGNVPANLEAREKYLKLANDYGNNFVYDILMKVDPLTAKKLHPNDVKRVVRALETYESGYLKSDINDDMSPRYNYHAFTIDMDRNKLYDRINLRADLLVANGLIEEVKGLMTLGITINNQCMQGIGYKEIYSYLIGEISLNESLELLKMNTRRYAKRQITFFKKLPNLINLTSENIDENVKRILEII